MSNPAHPSKNAEIRRVAPIRLPDGARKSVLAQSKTECAPEVACRCAKRSCETKELALWEVQRGPGKSCERSGRRLRPTILHEIFVGTTWRRHGQGSSSESTHGCDGDAQEKLHSGRRAAHPGLLQPAATIPLSETRQPRSPQCGWPRASTLDKSYSSQPKVKPIVLKMSRSWGNCSSTPPQSTQERRRGEKGHKDESVGVIVAQELRADQLQRGAFCEVEPTID